jgi:hypothetical protein
MEPRELSRESSIVIDVCEAHGTWFDAGELRAAAATAAPAPPKPALPSEAGPDDLQRRAAATLDVALALEQARDEETARRAVDVADDVVDTFNLFVLGRTRSPYGRRYR